MIINCANGNQIYIPQPTLMRTAFDGLDMHRAMLEDMDMNESTFKNTNLRGAFACGAKCANCDFTRANLITADFRRTMLLNSKFHNVTAFACLFQGANLNNSSFVGAKLDGAQLQGASLLGADMRCDGLETARLEGCVFDANTLWPRTFSPESHGCIRAY